MIPNSFIYLSGLNYSEFSLFYWL